MGRKGGKYKKKENNAPKKKAIYHDDDDMMNDEIDAFHKQRDIVPLDVNEDSGDSDEDMEHPVLDFEDDKFDKYDEDDDDDDDNIEDDSQLTGLAAKIARQQKYLRAKIGGVEEEMHDDAEEDEETERAVWGKAKNIFYNADNVDYEIQSSDEDLPAEEEAEVMRLQKEKAKSLTAEDFGLEDVNDNDSDKEPTYEEILVHGKPISKTYPSKEGKGDIATYEEVKKDINALTREEQMDVVYSSSPELVGLLSELNDALEQLENKLNPLLSKIGDGHNAIKGGMHYMEMKRLLLLSYCQAITFYLLLKSEGQPVRDHPVISRLVEIKNLLDKMKELDDNLASELEEILEKNESSLRVEKLVQEDPAINSGSLSEVHRPSVGPVEITEKPQALVGSPSVEEDSVKEHKVKKSKSKNQDNQVGKQSMEMLKVRAALEEKLKQKGIFNSISKKRDGDKKRLRPVNGQLETLDDFDDDAIELEKVNYGTDIANGKLLHPRKLSKLVTPQANKPKVVSGDDDLPRRDDIGERRRKHELRVLAGAGIGTVDDVDNEPGTLVNEGVSDMDFDGETESDLEFYKQAEQEHAAKIAAKAEMYSRPTMVTPLPEILVDGKRQISYQMEKNRGLTRARKKLTKNPRKKYKLKHQKAVVHRKGQVREIRKPMGSYGGEASGINASISRSIRLKS
ncbi:hypothetical protein ACH5RR_032216 [Cinchona calisaya]|uniref:Sas10 C-terminal domain-containing protein n=1 Tax=Cinchona calisaya TaxID=153742 RepID=A0ABD2YHF6_9GENT